LIDCESVLSVLEIRKPDTLNSAPIDGRSQPKG
jgi:hypothetical protein